jgi:hypothetical protein
VADIHATIHIPDHVWSKLLPIAKKLDELDREANRGRDWTGGRFSMLGLVGEWAFGQLTHMAPHYGFHDGGFDYPAVDVKTPAYFDDPWLKRWELDPFKAAYYALFGADLELRCVRYVGYATRDELRAAPKFDVGHGPMHTIPGAEIPHPELPRPTFEEIFECLMRAGKLPSDESVAPSAAPVVAPTA